MQSGPYVPPAAAADFENIPPAQQKGWCSNIERFLNLRSYGYLWRIPKHQRAYAWDSSFDDESPAEVEQFYLDVEQARVDGYTHSFGTLDCSKDPNPITLRYSPRRQNTYSELAINDGQQRLTTIFLCYAALGQIRSYAGDTAYRDEYNADPSAVVARGAMKLVDLRANAVPRFGLQEDVLTNHFLRLMAEGDAFAFNPRTVTGRVVTAANATADANMTGRLACQRMTKAYISLRKYLGDHANLDAWEAAFYASELTWVESDTPAHTLFEVRNSRGIPVKRLDQTKNWMLYLQNHWDSQGRPLNHPFTGAPLDSAALWWGALGHLENISESSAAEDVLLGHMRTIVDGMSLGSRATDYTSFQSEYTIENTDPASITDHRARLVDSMFAMKWTAQCMEEVFQKHPVFTTFVYGTFATQMSRGMTPIQRTKALVHLTDIVCRMDKKTVMSTLLLLTYRYVQPTQWVSFLHFVSKVIFRVYMVGREDLASIATGGGSFGTYCQTFFSSVKHINPESPISPADQATISAALQALQDSICTWAIGKNNLSDFYQKIRSPQDRYHGGTWTRFLLYHWEMHVSSDAASRSRLRLTTDTVIWSDPESNTQFFQLEHVMPKSGWVNATRSEVPANPRRAGYVAGERYWGQGPANPKMFVNEPEFDLWKNYLGNLVLSKQVPNRDFYRAHPYLCAEGDGESPVWLHEKRQMYRNYPGIFDHAQVRDLGLDYDEWNKDTILDRQEILARWAAYHWRLPCDPPPSSVFVGPLPLLPAHSPRYRAKILAGRGGGRGAAGAGHGGRRGQGVDADIPDNADAIPEADVEIPAIHGDGIDGTYDAEDSEFDVADQYDTEENEHGHSHE